MTTDDPSLHAAKNEFNRNLRQLMENVATADPRRSAFIGAAQVLIDNIGDGTSEIPPSVLISVLLAAVTDLESRVIALEDSEK